MDEREVDKGFRNIDGEIYVDQCSELADVVTMRTAFHCFWRAPTKYPAALSAVLRQRTPGAAFALERKTLHSSQIVAIGQKQSLPLNSTDTVPSIANTPR